MVMTCKMFFVVLCCIFMVPSSARENQQETVPQANFSTIPKSEHTRLAVLEGSLKNCSALDSSGFKSDNATGPEADSTAAADFTTRLTDMTSFKVHGSGTQLAEASLRARREGGSFKSQDVKNVSENSRPPRAPSVNRINGKIKLEIAGLFPITSFWPRKSPPEGLGVIPAVNLAIGHVNNHPDLLPRHFLDISGDDTRVSLLFLHQLRTSITSYNAEIFFV